MDSLHAEQCEPQMKIDIFVNAIRNTFFQQNEKSTKQTQTTEQPMMTLDASTTMDFEPKSTKQTQTTGQPMMTLDPSSSTKHRTSNSDTDSAYNTDTEHLPRPPCNKNQPKPGTSTWSNTQTTMKQPTRTPAASTYPQHTRKTLLLPTPPAPAEKPLQSTHYRNHQHQNTTSMQPFQDHHQSVQDHTSTAHQQHHIHKTFTILQQTSPTTNHCKTITDLQKLPPSATNTTSSIYKTIPTDTRTNLLCTRHSTAPDTTIHHMKIEDTG